MFPGTAKTSRPWSTANCAVMSAPLVSPASTTTVAIESPEIIRLRAENSLRPAVSQVHNRSRWRHWIIFSASWYFPAGKSVHAAAKHCNVRPPALSAAWWAIASTPRASLR